MGSTILIINDSVTFFLIFHKARRYIIMTNKIVFSYHFIDKQRLHITKYSKEIFANIFEHCNSLPMDFYMINNIDIYNVEYSKLLTPIHCFTIRLYW